MKKFNKAIAKRIVDLIRTDTYTVSEICKIARVSKTTFYNWINSNPEFAHDVEEAREELRQFIVKEAQKSLLKKIQGYMIEETKVVTIPSKDIDSVTKKPKPKIKEQVTTKKYVAPDTAAIIFTLTNREPGIWKNRVTNEVTGKDDSHLFGRMSDEELDTKITELEKKLGK